MNPDFIKKLKISDWVLIKDMKTASRIVDIQFMPEGYYVYGVLDLQDRIKYLTADELEKLEHE